MLVVNQKHLVFIICIIFVFICHFQFHLCPYDLMLIIKALVYRCVEFITFMHLLY